MPKPRIKVKAANLRGKLSISAESFKRFEKELRRLEIIARAEVVRRALQAGGDVIHDAAEARAPGPHIVTKIVTGAELMQGWKSSAAAQGLKPGSLYIIIGPDKDHWYYRFAEYGIKAHGVKRRKRTRYSQYLKAQGVKASQAKKYKIGKRSVSMTRPAMVFTIDGKLIFARKVKGSAARPFLRPAVDTQGDTAMQRVGDVLADEIVKAARS
jgi:HK97 gp10 family phage protein